MKYGWWFRVLDKNQMSKLFWAMLSFITRLPDRVAGPRDWISSIILAVLLLSFDWIIAWRD